MTHAALSGHELGAQLKSVQYPLGCELSQTRVPCSEQSVLRTHLSPTCGVQPVSRRAAVAARTARAKRARRDMGKGGATAGDPTFRTEGSASTAGSGRPRAPGGRV